MLPPIGLRSTTLAAGTIGAQAVVRMPGASIPGYGNATVQGQWLVHSGLKEDAALLLKQHYVPAVEYPEELAVLLPKEVQATVQGGKSPEQAIQAYKQAREPALSKK